MGRPRKPTEQKKREGRRYSGEPPTSTRGAPTIPPEIKASPAYRAKWKEVCDWLDQMGVLTISDRDTIAMYVTATCDFYECLKLCRTKGRYTTGSRGQPCVQPWVRDMREHFTNFFRAAPRLGLTIVDREKLAGLVKPDDESDDEMEQMFKIA